ncbi:hypothetical protein [Archangium violaceum]|uniref:hypothetical protein n=1 Tax=Archangium violaceum TaxID=83451 RepID=UPI0036DEF5AA
MRATFEDGQPIAGVSVLLNGAESGQTDSTGQLFLDTPAGQHVLRLNLDAGEGRVSKAEQRIEMGTESQTVTVKLPRPVRMLTPLEVTTSMVHLAWERSEEPHFREYKVYAHHYSPAFDETTGTLIHVGTDASRTDFQLSGVYLGGSPLVSAGKTLYFRVFVLKDDGSLAGSSVLQVKTPSWSNEPHFTRFYRLSIERQFAGARPIHGVAHDGSALWLLYRQEVGGYYDNDKLTLVRLDPVTRAVLAEIPFEDYLVPQGLAWDGASLWVNFDNKLVRINASTGELEQSFMATSLGMSVTWTGSHLLRTNGAARATKLEQVDPATGASSWGFTNPFSEYGSHSNKGIAYRSGEVWLTDRVAQSGIAIIDDSGTHVGFVEGSFSFPHMTFMDGKLVGVSESSQVYILNIQQSE